VTISSYIFELSNSLQALYPLDEAKSVAKYFVSEFLNLSNTDILIRQSDFISSDSLAILNSQKNRLLKGEPVQYVTGKSYFYGLEFLVDKNVLIPRQETEILVDSIINRFKNSTHIKILDIGTGSGCIAISLKKFLPQARIWALDISEKALAVCIHNASKNEVEISTILFDILGNDTFPLDTKFDIIVSNPPYVLESEKQLMHKNVTGFEPDGALYVTNSDPLIFYRQISVFAAEHLNANGELYFEINERFAEQVSEITQKCGFKDQIVIEDLNKKSRFVHSVL